MILLVHMIFGAAVASKIHNPFLAVFAAFLSHYFLDFFPHNEYGIHNIQGKRWKKSGWEFAKVFADFFCGIILLLYFFGVNPIIFIAAFFAILPDGLAFLNYFSKNKILEAHNNFHHGILHYFSDSEKPEQSRYGTKKIPAKARILIQVLAFAISILIIRL